MAISNELSSDVAVALLAKKKSPQELKKLKDIILEVHYRAPANVGGDAHLPLQKKDTRSHKSLKGSFVKVFCVICGWPFLD